MAGEGSAAAPPPHALEVTPESALQFTLTRSPPDRTTNHSADATAARCTMTLRHPGGTSEHLAFKVKTTQPRRYLVRPNQGVVAPNTTETVSILLVEKDKQILLQSYDRLGQSALDHSKDKFLVQSCAVSDDFAKECAAKKVKADASSDSKTAKELAEALTSMWNTAAGSGGSQPIHNKKLHVRHVVPPGEGVSSSSAASGGGSRPTPPPSALREADKPPLESMSPEQMYAEVSNLRRKYDELVAFSVNLTAERDILNNTLEQTKRDLNREVASRAAIENRGGAPPREAAPAAKSGGGVSIFMLLLVSIVVFLAAVKATNMDKVGFLEDLPVLGPILGFGEEGEEGAAAVPTGGGSGEL